MERGTNGVWCTVNVLSMVQCGWMCIIPSVGVMMFRLSEDGRVKKVVCYRMSR